MPQYFIEVYAASGYNQEVLHLLERYKSFVSDGQKGDKEKTEFLIAEIKKAPFCSLDRNDLKKFGRDQIVMLRLWLDLMAEDNIGQWLELLKKIYGYSDPNYRGCRADPLEEAKKISPFPEGSHLLIYEKNPQGYKLDTSLLNGYELFRSPTERGNYLLIIPQNSEYKIIKID